ncbi:MAG: cell wall-active antibiotics response protein [Acidobacteria bacterium]|nr:cell wall-active antibiotics response protein [Acidobacteriota bacterium]
MDNVSEPSDLGRRRYHRHGLSTAIIGIGVLALGVALTLDNLGIVSAERFVDYWPVLLILLGVSHLVRPGASRGVVSGVIWILVGAGLLADNLGLIPFEIWDLWPLLLVVIGAHLIFKPLRRRAVVRGEAANSIEATAVLGGVKRTLAAESFEGGSATAIMGGCEIDLRGSSSEGPPASIDTFAFWGGVEIRVPEDWEVQAKGTAVLGAFVDKTQPSGLPARKVLVVSGLAIMGGVEVSN